MTHSIADNLTNVHQLIQQSAAKAGRLAQDIELLAVSKMKPVSDIVLAYEYGQRKFGENYVQEGVDKIAELKHLSAIEWHFIGPLQSNKTRLVAENFDWMHSLDRLKIATRLNEQRSPHQSPLNVCVQVNIDEEASKAGVLPQDVMPLLEELSVLPCLKIRGLMAIPLATDDKQQQQRSFKQMQQLFLQCKQAYPEFDTLSIGMSGDIDSAIACGSTMVRVGTGIFGARSKAS